MEYKLTLNVFRFDARTDYLPYYKKFVLSIDEEASAADLLGAIKEEEVDFGYPTDVNAAIKINGLSLFTRTKIKKIVKDFGKELTLESISSKRVVKDLSINSDDFNERFDILDAFVEAIDKKKYKKFIREYYASEILSHNENYFGDAIFALAYDMIEKYPERKAEMLQAICDADNGIWQHINITNRLYPYDDSLQAKIDMLKNEIIQTIPEANSFVEQQANANI